MRIVRILLTIAVAVAAFVAATQAASAATVELSPESISASANGELTFEDGGGTQVSCNFTLGGTVAGSVTSEPGEWTLVGAITEGVENGCTGASAFLFLVEPAWNVEARVFLDTPSTGQTTIEIRINDAKFLLHDIFGFVDCLYAGNLLATSTITGNSGTITQLNFGRQEVAVSDAELNSIFCPNPRVLYGAMTTAIGVRITL